MKLYTLSLLFVLISISKLSAQTDTIRILQYNLLNYGNAANPVTFKDSRLSTIINYVQPDIFGTNEIRNDSTLCDHLLNTMFGQGWARGYYSNTNNETQVNMLFWNSQKFIYRGQDIVCSNLRDIIAYKLYYKDTINTLHDTVKLTVIVGHLKASDGSSEAAARAAETQAVADYLNNNAQTGNYIFMGDLNLYTDQEQAYQNLINSSNPFSHLNDPVNQPGVWHDDSTFAPIHTQATRTTTLGDGGVTGGLDDRFDFMLVSDAIMSNTAHMRYINGTYKAVGQDGQHFNKALTDAPVNTAAPSNVIQALYEMSDHLPVTAKFSITPPTPPVNSIADVGFLKENITIVNPFDEHLFIYTTSILQHSVITYTLFSASGNKILQSTAKSPSGKEDIELPVNISPGMYILQVSDSIHPDLYIKLVHF